MAEKDNISETLDELKEKKEILENLQEKYNYDSEMNVFSNEADYKRYANDKTAKITEKNIEKLEDNIVAKIKNVSIMNEYEKSKTQGFKEQIRFIKNYIKGNDLEDKLKNLFKPNLLKEAYEDTGLIAVIAAPVLLAAQYTLSIPAAIGMVVAATGIRLTKFMTMINSNPEIVNELKQAGVYDKITDYLEKQKASRIGKLYDDSVYEHIDDSYLYSKFVEEDLVKGRGL